MLTRMIITISVVLISIATIASASEKSSCLLSQDLQKSAAARIRYMMKVAKLNQEQPSDPEELYRNVTLTSLSGEPEIDEMSFDCLTCHDGLAAPTYDVRIKNSPYNRIVDIHSIRGSHPIGMDYALYTRSSQGFRSGAELNPNMIFIKGKVGCLTCHNPLNPEKDHLVMNNRGSALCLTCHNK